MLGFHHFWEDIQYLIHKKQGSIWANKVLKDFVLFWGQMGSTRGMEGAGRSAHRATFRHILAVLAVRWGPSWLEPSTRGAHLQEGL